MSNPYICFPYFQLLCPHLSTLGAIAEGFVSLCGQRNLMKKLGFVPKHRESVYRSRRQGMWCSKVYWRPDALKAWNIIKESLSGV
ncbi:hypothetical protein BT63DRAFT_107196 [Microthyrium microscopicum]|uniref:Uncharacterized protein n=1 Tax=Microthyrium microscopicum TaxID=703497 RepID=A0A6A6TX38_9PEZI|nr:hypothetical protein BT63DRAFT_107196 [Microthyrium microscopicum]